MTARKISALAKELLRQDGVQTIAPAPAFSGGSLRGVFAWDSDTVAAYFSEIIEAPDLCQTILVKNIDGRRFALLWSSNDVQNIFHSNSDQHLSPLLVLKILNHAQCAMFAALDGQARSEVLQTTSPSSFSPLQLAAWLALRHVFPPLIWLPLLRAAVGGAALGRMNVLTLTALVTGSHCDVSDESLPLQWKNTLACRRGPAESERESLDRLIHLLSPYLETERVVPAVPSNAPETDHLVSNAASASASASASIKMKKEKHKMTKTMKKKKLRRGQSSVHDAVHDDGGGATELDPQHVHNDDVDNQDKHCDESGDKAAAPRAEKSMTALRSRRNMTTTTTSTSASQSASSSSQTPETNSKTSSHHHSDDRAHPHHRDAPASSSVSMERDDTTQHHHDHHDQSARLSAEAVSKAVAAESAKTFEAIGLVHKQLMDLQHLLLNDLSRRGIDDHHHRRHGDGDRVDNGDHDEKKSAQHNDMSTKREPVSESLTLHHHHEQEQSITMIATDLTSSSSQRRLNDDDAAADASAVEVIRADAPPSSSQPLPVHSNGDGDDDAEHSEAKTVDNVMEMKIPHPASSSTPLASSSSSSAPHAESEAYPQAKDSHRDDDARAPQTSSSSSSSPPVVRAAVTVISASLPLPPSSSSSSSAVVKKSAQEMISTVIDRWRIFVKSMIMTMTITTTTLPTESSRWAISAVGAKWMSWGLRWLRRYDDHDGGDG